VATYAQIVEANRAGFAAWNAHDPDAVAALFAEDATIRDVGSPDPVHGREAIHDRAASLLVAFPDFRLRQLDLVVGEDANADRWEASGTHSGVFLGMDATGNRVEVEGATFSRFDSSGLVVEDVNIWDVGALLAQLGGAARA
jgi:steroid delta-isomerase-like uncharacterized protein